MIPGIGCRSSALTCSPDNHPRLQEAAAWLLRGCGNATLNQMGTTMAMRTRVSRLALLLLALAFLVVALLGCQAVGSVPLQGSDVAIISGTTAAKSSATPAFSPFTIGAWPSNSAPSARDSIAIYVICHVQDPTMANPSTPAAGLSVRVTVLDPINRTYTGTTGSDGIAIVQVTFAVSQPGLPVLVDVSATWHGVTYQGQTSFTPEPVTKPSSSGTSVPHKRPTPLPSPTPKPKR